VTTFAGVMDFDCPQPFNVELGPEADISSPVPQPVEASGSVPVVAQEISPDRDLYPRVRYGVRQLGRKARR
jgi:hypothetical protein